MAKASSYKPNSTPQTLRNLSNADLARIDKQVISKIESPNLSKMWRLIVGKTQYFFNTQEKYDKAVLKYSQAN